MRSLGDKISSTIIAQSAGVNCVEWSGSDVTISQTSAENISIDAQTYNSACINSIESLQLAAARIGYPLMIKASEGGGGKGIRMVKSQETLQSDYETVKTEVPGSPIFAMKLCTEAKHLEIQLIGDEYGNYTTIYGRDCSVQRRHQKIFEEGPILAASNAAIKEMEMAAIRLAQKVKYSNAGTVEFLYRAKTDSYFFLELNPRLQVEHPVSEIISGINIPALQLQISMGIPLYNIPDIRAMYSKNRNDLGTFDMNLKNRRSPSCHVIAARITAENPSSGFRPNLGILDGIDFVSSYNVWAYFSIGRSSQIHQFCDSQFGHVFARGETREDARRALISAIQDLKIQGSFINTKEALLNLLDRKEYKSLDFDTNWLDRLIQGGQITNLQTLPNLDTAVCVSAFMAVRNMKQKLEEFHKYLERGLATPTHLTEIKKDINFFLGGLHIVAQATYSPKIKQIVIELNKSILHARVIQERPDGGITICYNERRHSIYLIDVRASTERYSIDDCTIVIRTTDDNSNVESSSPGKLIKYKVENGDYVREGQPIAEIEVMKMCLEIASPKDGKIVIILTPGTVLKSGEVIARVESEITEQQRLIKKFDEVIDIPIKTTGNLYSDLLGKLETISESLTICNYSPEMLPSTVTAVQEICQRKTFVKDFLLYNVHRKEKPERLKSMQTLNSMKASDLTSHSIQSQPAIDQYADNVAKFENYHGFNCILDCLNVFLDHAQALDCFANIEEICLSYRGKDTLDAFLKVRFYETIDQRAASFFIVLSSCYRVFGKIEEHNEFCNIIKALSELRSPVFAKLARRCKELLFQWQLPSLQQLYEKMEVKFESALISEGYSEERERRSFIDDMVRGFSTHLDVLPRFFIHTNSKISQLALEIYVRRISESYTLCSINSISNCIGSLHWTFGIGMDVPVASEREYAMSPGLNENGEVVDDLGEQSELRSGIITSLGEKISFSERLSHSLAMFRKSGTRRNVLYFVVPVDVDIQPKLREEEYVQSLSELLQREIAELQSSHTSRVTLVLVRNSFPSLGFYTFRASLDYKEDRTIRHLDPSMAYLLEFSRLSNYHVGFSHADPTGQIHIYHGKANSDPTMTHDRLFVRLIIRPNQAMRHFNTIDELLQEMFRILEDTFDSVESVLSTINVSKTLSNHLFLNVLPVFVNTASQVEDVIRIIMDKYQQRIRKLLFRQAEVKMNLATARGAPPTRHRFLLSNETGHKLDITAFYEERDPISGRYIMHQLCKPKVLNNIGIPSSTPYQSTLEPTQLKRYKVQSTMGTTYVYDFATLFEQAILEALPKAQVSFEEGQLDTQGRLEFRSRPIGTNKCGMVTWLCKVTQGSRNSAFIIIGNDIDFEIGSFGVEEDQLFYEASKYARIHKMPRIFLSANSGARIGLADEVWNGFKVAWNDDANPSKGFKYLYFEEEQMNTMSQSVKFERIQVSSTSHHYKITDIIGCKDGIGVENLQGSALIAGETAVANDESFTMTLVTGRSVGIGAYLVRLGQRAIQRIDQPIILTGYAALNSILGREVYQNNLQLGGPQTMYVNGVSHLVVRDDWDGVLEVVKWLQFLPTFSQFPTERPDTNLDRDVQVLWETSPTSDPRVLLGGDNQGNLGLLDANSFKEYLSDWAQSVIVGRGRLGGQSVGIIATECRTTVKKTPADPANPQSQQSVYPQAGQVWFPDSAFKTATALRDFKGEQLPILIVANWRGFSGGQRDLFQEILKFGSMIVEQLSTYPLPVIVYIPPKGELRGGSWVSKS